MLAGGTAAATAAAAILFAEGGVAALVRGAGCYVALCLAWLLLDVALAWVALSGRLPIVPWRPNLLFRVYPVSKSNLLDRVSRRFERPRRRPPASGASSSSTDPHRAFGAVVGTCPFAHIGGASLANAALRAQPVKAPLYRAFEAFAGEGVFTAEGSDWAEKRAEVLAAFATAGLEPLADASKSVARRLAAEIERDLARDLTPGETKALPALQRATLRATFEYLAGRSIAEALEATATEEPRDVNTKFHPSSPGAPSSSPSSSNTAPSSMSSFASAALRWEDEYLAAATSLRHLIPARARSVWMASDWLYSLSPVGRLEARCVRAARRLPELAVRAAREGSPLAILAAGPAHGGGGGGDGGGDGSPAAKAKAKAGDGAAARWWEAYMGGGVFVRGASSGASPGNHPPGTDERDTPRVVTKALLDEAVTLVFAGHDTQSATLAWALTRLSADLEFQAELRESLLADPLVAADLGVGDLLTRGGEETPRSPSSSSSSSSSASAPAWRTSEAAPRLEAVLRETLRLHPVAPLVVRKLQTDVAAPDGDATLPAGCAAAVWLHAVHRDERAWERPDDFYPARWLEEAEAGGGSGSGGASPRRGLVVRRKGPAFMPFASGPRSCVGQHLAWVFMRVALARLVARFEWTPAEAREGEEDATTPSVGFTVTPANGARLRARAVSY